MTGQRRDAEHNAPISTGSRQPTGYTFGLPR